MIGRYSYKFDNTTMKLSNNPELSAKLWMTNKNSLSNNLHVSIITVIIFMCCIRIIQIEINI